jgi:hypothetical protein
LDFKINSTKEILFLNLKSLYLKISDYMSILFADLDNPANWNQVFDLSLNAIPVSQSNRFVPIENQIIPNSLQSGIIAVYVNCTTGKTNWNDGGYCLIQTPVAVESPSLKAIRKHRLYLYQTNLVKIDIKANSYNVEFEIPNWFSQITLKCWEYTGIIS